MPGTSPAPPAVHVALVCLGNICRSPLAEALLRHHLARLPLRGLSVGAAERFEVRSMGTGDWHVGGAADRRTVAEAKRRGVDLSAHRAAHFTAEDLAAFDLVVVMDAQNRRDVLRLDPSGQHAHKVRRLRDFDPTPEGGDVPDPYYGGPEGFARVHDLIDRSTAALAEHLIAEANAA